MPKQSSLKSSKSRTSANTPARRNRSLPVTQARPSRPRKSGPWSPSDMEVIEAKLPNGLQVRLVPNASVPTVSMYTFFRVGSRNERPGVTGISHLFEHMMFNGAKKYGAGMFDRVLESSGGYSNAYTSHDITVYHEDFAAEALETVIDLESDRMASLRISDKMLASEREVVKEERRMRVENENLGLMEEELESLIFQAHPYRWPVIGWMGDIENISREDCETFFRTYYAPNNATLYIAGDFDTKKTLALVKKYYGKIKRGPPAPPVVNSEPGQRGERRSTLRLPAQAPAVLLAYRGPEAKAEDTLALDLVQYILSVGESSRLNRSLIHDQNVAVSVALDWSWRIDPGAVMVQLELKPGADVAAAESALEKELEKLIRDGVTENELQRAKNNLNAHFLREFATNGGRAHGLGSYEIYFGDWREGLKLPERYAAITAAQVQAAAKKYLVKEHRSVVLLDPVAEEVAT